MSQPEEDSNCLTMTLVTLVGCVGGFCFLINLIFPWIKYDLQTLWPVVKCFVKFRKIKRNNEFLIDMFEKHVKKQPNKDFVIFEGKNYTYSDIEKRANQIGNAFCSLGIRQGDAVGLLDYNGVDFVVTYLALAKLGASAVLLNTNQRSDSLLHSIKVSEAETLIIGNSEELIKAVKDIQSNLKDQSLDIYVFGKHDLPKGMDPLDPIVEDAVDDPVIHGLREGVKYQDPACYIFTSGTTGLPKAAVVTHSKVVKSLSLLISGGAGKSDIVYTTLPLYHSAGMSGMCGVIHLGATIAIRKKFSASNFIKDCVETKATIVQYIGEMCRFLLATDPTDADRKHYIRVAIGNGLRQDIWSDFQKRFNIPDIMEIYAATEGNAGLFNVCNKTGAVGRASPLYTAFIPTALVKYDDAKEEAVRDNNGHCIKTKALDKPGLLILKIEKNAKFDGYKGATEETNKKILKDVFKKGDQWFNTGDLFTQDEDYFLYFADRTGDTFRWKGENVSTTEVGNQMTTLKWIEDANVYGVKVQGNDGKAGMAAIQKKGDHKVNEDDLTELYNHCKDVLPNYAIPRFLRIEDQSEMTSTFKLPKAKLVEDGYAPSNAEDYSLYIIDFNRKTYVPLTSSLYNDVNNGKLRL